MTEEEQWSAYLAYGQAEKAASAPAVPGASIIGRYITVLAKALALFWGRHKATLIPHLTSTAIAALDAIVSELPNILTVNPPGPT